MTVACQLPLQEVLDRYAAGETAAQIGRVFGCSKQPVLRLLQQAQVTRRKPAPARLERLDKAREAITAAYVTQVPMRLLAEQYGCSEYAIKSRLTAWRVEIRRTGPSRHIEMNERFFETIDSEVKAYWLGFAFADGSVTRNHRQGKNWHFALSLAAIDRDHVFKFADAIGRATPPVYIPKANQYCVNVCSAQFCRDLVSHDCVPRKTYGCRVPKLPDELYRHFFRGCVDGDGSLFHSGRSLGFSMCGHLDFLTEMQQWLCEHASLSQTKIRRQGVLSELKYTGNIQVPRISSLLYDGATVYLDRKYTYHLRITAGGTTTAAAA